MPGDLVDHPAQDLHNSRLRLFVAFSTLAIAVATAYSLSLRWVNDDAFISFRYAKNLAQGMGLVYNAGERVEGYTNFLWTTLISFGIKFGLDPVRFSMVVGISCSLMALLLFVRLGWILQQENGLTIILPLTGMALVIHRDFNIYATG